MTLAAKPSVSEADIVRHVDWTEGEASHHTGIVSESRKKAPGDYIQLLV